MGRAAKDSIMKAVAALLVFVLHQVSSNWSGSGEFSCYGHLSTDVSTPEGGDYLGEGKVICNIVEWGGGPLGPEAMFFKPTAGRSSRSGRGTTMTGTTSTGPRPTPPARARYGTRRTTRAPATARPTRRRSTAVATPAVSGTSSVQAAD